MNELRSAVVVALLVLLAPRSMATQTPRFEPELAEVTSQETAYWQAYNRCDTAQMAELSADDVEFYHDASGAAKGKAELARLIAENICADPRRRVRRETSAADVRVFPLKSDGKVYGAIVSGEHRFYVDNQAAPEYLDTRARFSHLWLREEGGWKMARILSFDHAPAPYKNTRSAIRLSSRAMDPFVGSFAGRDDSVFVVSKGRNALIVEIDGKKFTFHPMDKQTFFLKDEDLTVAFAPNRSGDGQDIIVRERGIVVDGASRKLNRR